MSLVLDSSAALAWVYADETTGPIRQVFEQLTLEGAWVPGLWRLEVANILEMGVRRGRHDAAFRDATLADLDRPPPHTSGGFTPYPIGMIIARANCAEHRL